MFCSDLGVSFHVCVCLTFVTLSFESIYKGNSEVCLQMTVSGLVFSGVELYFITD